MIRIINGKVGKTSSVTLRCDCCGHTVRVSTQVTVPTNGSLIDGQGALPAPALHVEDLVEPEGIPATETELEFLGLAGKADVERQAHARRVAAALAAVEGISTEALESGAIAKLIKVAGAAIYFVCMDQPEYGQLQRALDGLKPATAPEAVAKLPVTK